MCALCPPKRLANSFFLPRSSLDVKEIRESIEQLKADSKDTRTNFQDLKADTNNIFAALTGRFAEIHVPVPAFQVLTPS